MTLANSNAYHENASSIMVFWESYSAQPRFTKKSITSRKNGQKIAETLTQMIYPNLLNQQFSHLEDTSSLRYHNDLFWHNLTARLSFIDQEGTRASTVWMTMPMSLKIESETFLVKRIEPIVPTMLHQDANQRVHSMETNSNLNQNIEIK